MGRTRTLTGTMVVLAYLAGILVALVVLPMAFFNLFVGKALPVAKTRLKSTERVEYEKSRWHVFRPRGQALRAGVVLYQGGFADAIAYAWLGHALAERGILVVIPELPQRAAMARPMEATAIIDAHPYVPHWFISGHSLGGIGSAFYAKKGEYRERLSGQIILASFLRDSRDMSGEVHLPTLTIYGTRDGHAEKFEPFYKNFSSDSRLVCIEGANHGQFGEYGFHMGDNTPEIPREAQQAAIVGHMTDFIAERLGEHATEDQQPEPTPAQI